MKSPQLYLASSSPRRIEMLKNLQYRFSKLNPNIDETILKGEKAKAMVLRLARTKALVAASQLPIKKKKIKALVLSADTCVVSPKGDEVLGKPTSRKDAKRMLQMIQGRTHTVFTAYCILEMKAGKLRRILSKAVSTRVKIRSLNEDEIQDYIKTGEPMDKAGSYGAQGIGMYLVESISGSYSNVVGLPLSEVVEDLKLMGLSL